MYYASMPWSWQLIWIMVKTNHPCLRVGRQKYTGKTSKHRGSHWNTDRKLASFPRLTQTEWRMMRWTEANASWSNRSTVATYEHADSTTFSTCLQLMGGDAELGGPSRAASPRVASPKTPAPATSVLVVPYGAPPAPSTSVANIADGWSRPARYDSYHQGTEFFKTQ
jgi:hypothetical protein